MDKIDDHIWVLITRELSGEAGAGEKKELQQWLDEKPRNKEFYNSIKSSWEKDPEQPVDDPFLFDLESGRRKLRSKLGKEKTRRPEHQFRKTGRTRFAAWKIAASIVFLLLASSVYLTVQHWEEPVPVTYTTSEMEQRIITLSDRSVVRLNENSKLELAQHFNDGNRGVRLEGEAFFDIVEDPENPFLINVGEAVVKVLGTSFNVKEGDEIMVVVQDGVVSFRHKNLDERNAARLSAGQLGLLSENGNQIKVEDANVENYLSWMNGYLRFESMPFVQVARQLERIYGVKSEFQDPSISSFHLTVYTERVQMEEVFETIALALDLEYEKKEDTIMWMKKSE